jgi:AcrR family transcriptional regulator
VIAEKLPHGRHGLSREQVAESQRRRILRAMAEAVAERGYAATPVAEVLRRAGVSRETFYEQFANKEECFLAAYEAGVGIVLEATGVAASADREREGVLDAVLHSYLTTLASDPAIARTFMVEVYAGGEAALARRAEVQDRFAAQVAAWTGARTAAQRQACEMIVAAAIGLVTQWICAGRIERLTELHEPLMQHVESVLAANGLPSETLGSEGAR